MTSPAKEETIGKKLKKLQAGKFLTVGKVKGGGTLAARKLSSGAINFYWRYTADGKTDRIVVGVYDSKAPAMKLEPTSKGFSVEAAMSACEALSAKQRKLKEDGGIREAERVKRENKRIALEAEAAAKLARDEHAKLTLDVLCQTYVDYLKSNGRSSHRDAATIFKNHLVEASPELAKTPADQVTFEQITDLQRELLKKGRGRTANKLRAYLRAAFQCAVSVRTKAQIPDTFKKFKIAANPAALTERAAEFDRADKNPLTAEELRTYWQAIKDLEGTKGAALRLHLLTGGQRIEQLVRLKNAEVKADRIFLWDSKGRPGQGARKHEIPLTKQAQVAILELVAGNQGTYAISSGDGTKRITNTTLSGWAKESAPMIEKFTLKRVRSGVETALSKATIRKDIRGQLQSHGLTGIQEKHYDGHDYFEEKLEALNKLFELIEPPVKGKVIQFKGAA